MLPEDWRGKGEGFEKNNGEKVMMMMMMFLRSGVPERGCDDGGRVAPSVVASPYSLTAKGAALSPERHTVLVNRR